MIYSFYCSIVYDVVKEVYFSSRRCVNAHTEYAPDMYTDFDESISNNTFYNYTIYDPISCYYAQFIEYPPEYQRYYDPTGSRRYGLSTKQAVQSDVMWVFLFCQVFSFCVLIIYIISSIMNPVVMLTIASKKVKC